MKRKLYVYIIPFLCLACSEIEARRPKQHSTTSFYKEVIEENKKLNKVEQKKIELLLAKDTLTNYLVSSSGFWYAYKSKDTLNTRYPAKGDIVNISYNISDVQGNLIYEEITRDYTVDKEDLIPALQEGIKLMKKGETITFVIPSYRAYGVVGDGNKIGINKTLKSTLTLIDIKN